MYCGAPPRSIGVPRKRCLGLLAVASWLLLLAVSNGRTKLQRGETRVSTMLVERNKEAVATAPSARVRSTWKPWRRLAEAEAMAPKATMKTTRRACCEKESSALGIKVEV